jgi:hypothetical protein|tara:strand:- start:727 stop:1185 length:459 start_codon:yes stop_codon:yes gene_type:complete
MHQPMETIKIIKLINGDDIVCSFPKEQLGQKSPLIRIVKPLLIKYVPQLTSMGIKDYIALIKWAAYTNDAVITIPKDKILTITNASSEMGKSYSHMASNYDKIEEAKKDDNAYKRQAFSDKDNQKLNEIFDEIGDDEFNEHIPPLFKKKTLH